MLGDVLVSGGGKLRVLSPGMDAVRREATLESCGAVCVSGGTVFAAGESEGVIYRLDRSLLPNGVYAGGPGMRGLCVSGDDARLYVLLGDADSVMMLSAADGTPRFLARTGANPQRMRLAEKEGAIIIAGGMDAGALMLCGETLSVLACFREEGFCCDAVLHCGTLYMLCLTDSMETRLVMCFADGSRRRIHLPGIPGSLYASGSRLMAAAGACLYVFDVRSMDLIWKRSLEGLCGKLIRGGKGLMLLDPSYGMLAQIASCGMRILGRNIKDAAAWG